jgi:hypothetical protein
MIAALVAALTCAATPVHTEPMPTSTGVLAKLPWVAAAPARAGVTGFVWYRPFADNDGRALMYTNETAPGGAATKILWIIRNRHAASTVTVTSQELTTGQKMRQRFRQVGGGGVAGHQYASIIRVPTAGCWRVTITSGRRVRASVVFSTIAAE